MDGWIGGPERWSRRLAVWRLELEVVILELVLGNSGASNEGCARGVVVDAEEIVEWRF